MKASIASKWLVIAAALGACKGANSEPAAKAKAEQPAPKPTEKVAEPPPTADEVVHFLEGAMPIATAPARVDLKGPVNRCTDADCAKDLLPRVSAWARVGLAEAKVEVKGDKAVARLSSAGFQDVGVPVVTMTIELHRATDLVIDSVDATWEHMQAELTSRDADGDWPEQKAATLSAMAKEKIRAEVRSRFPKCGTPRIGATQADPLFAAAWCTGAAGGGENIVWLAVRGDTVVSFAATVDAPPDPEFPMSTESMGEDAPIVLDQQVCVNVMDLDQLSDRGHERLLCAARPDL